MECLPPEVTEPRQPVSNYLCYVPFIVPNIVLFSHFYSVIISSCVFHPLLQGKYMFCFYNSQSYSHINKCFTFGMTVEK